MVSVPNFDRVTADASACVMWNDAVDPKESAAVWAALFPGQIYKPTTEDDVRTRFGDRAAMAWAAAVASRRAFFSAVKEAK